MRYFTLTCILLLFCCAFRYLSWIWNTWCFRLSLVWLRNNVIEVDFCLAMIWISVASIILWTFLRAIVVEAFLFNDFFLFKLSVWIILFAVLSHFCSSITVYVLNWVMRRENHFFLVEGRVVDSQQYLVTKVRSVLKAGVDVLYLELGNV